MKESKIKLSVYCLYACAAVQGLSFLYGVASAMKYLVSASAEASLADLSAVSYVSMFGGSAVYTAVFVAAALWVVKELKNDSVWGWLWGIIAFGFSLFSFALPAALLGLVSLLDKRVRGDYMQKLDIQL